MGMRNLLPAIAVVSLRRNLQALQGPSLQQSQSNFFSVDRPAAGFCALRRSLVLMMRVITSALPGSTLLREAEQLQVWIAPELACFITPPPFGMRLASLGRNVNHSSSLRCGWAAAAGTAAAGAGAGAGARATTTAALAAAARRSVLVVDVVLVGEVALSGRVRGNPRTSCASKVVLSISGNE